MFFLFFSLCFASGAGEVRWVCACAYNGKAEFLSRTLEGNGRVKGGKAGKGRMEHNERKGDQHFIDFWRQFSFFWRMPFTFNSHFFFFFLLLNFPVSRLLHKARYPGLLEFGGGFFFSLQENKNTPLPIFALWFVCCCQFRLSDLPQPISKTTDGMDFAAFFFVQFTYPATYPTVFLLCRTVLRPPHGFMPGPTPPNSHTNNYYHGRPSKSIRAAYFVNG